MKILIVDDEEVARDSAFDLSIEGITVALRTPSFPSIATLSSLIIKPFSFPALYSN